MKSKKSFFSKALIYNDLRRFWWVGALYTLLLLLTSPLVLLTNLERTRDVTLYNLLGSNVMFLFILPIFIAVIMTRYTQSPKAMVAIHAMPYTRLQLYVNKIAAGLILTVGPLIINAAALFLVKGYTIYAALLSAETIWTWFGIVGILSVTLYAWTTLIGMFTGSSIAQIIFTYIFNFLVIGIMTSVNYLLSGVVFGFVGVSDEMLESLGMFSPLIQVLMIYGRSKTLSDIWLINVIVTLIVFIIGYVIYRYRNLEDATEVISGKYIKPLFKYGVTFCTMLLGASYIKGIFGEQVPNLWVYVGFALLGYIIAEMLLRKSFRIWDSYKGFIGFVGAFAIIVAFVKFDVIGFEKYIPEIEQIECVSINSNQRFLREASKDNYSSGVLYEADNIEKLVNLHRSIINYKSELKNERYSNTVNIGYKLKNGKTIFRSYDIGYNVDIMNLQNGIFNSKEYKVTTHKIFKTTEEDYKYITIETYDANDRQTIMISDKEEMKKFLDCIKTDLLNLTEEELRQYRNIYSIGLTYKKDLKVENFAQYPAMEKYALDTTAGTEMYSFNINAKNIDAYVKAAGYKVTLYDADKISKMVVYKVKEYSNNFTEMKTITDKAKIREIVDILPMTNDAVYGKDSEGYRLEIFYDFNADYNADVVEVFNYPEFEKIINN